MKELRVIDVTIFQAFFNYSAISADGVNEPEDSSVVM